VSLRAVLFDAGNTLLFLDYGRLAREVGRALGRPLAAEDLALQAKPAALALERADTTDRERASDYLERLFLLAGVPAEAIGQVRDVLLRLHRQQHLWSASDERTPLALERLRNAGIRLGVVSNSDGRCEEALIAADLRKYFDVVVDSHDVGVEKPDPRIFWHALHQMAIAPADALYVGDIYEVDVVGARRAGMNVILLDPLKNHDERDAQTARSIAELVDQVLSPGT